MGRKKKQTVQELSTTEKLYIDLSIKTYNNINYDELFKRLSAELEKPEDIIRDYANKKSPPTTNQQLPPEPAPRQLKPEQEMVRNIMTPNRLTEPNNARRITMMSEAASDTMEKVSPSTIKGSSKTSSYIFRQ